MPLFPKQSIAFCVKEWRKPLCDFHGEPILDGDYSNTNDLRILMVISTASSARGLRKGWSRRLSLIFVAAVVYQYQCKSAGS